MDLQTTLSSALNSYGLIAVFISIIIGALGVPLPTSFLLILVGSFIENGDMGYWPVLGVGVLGAILGDHGAYFLGRWGGRPLLSRFHLEQVVAQAEQTTERWGNWAIFLSRWLITAVGPYISLFSGISQYHWVRFSLSVIAGELIWVALYIQIGRYFSDSVALVSDTLGSIVWILLGCVVIGGIGYQLWQNQAKGANS